MGLRVEQKRSMLSSSNLARVSVSEKSSPLYIDSTSTRTWRFRIGNLIEGSAKGERAHLVLVGERALGLLDLVAQLLHGAVVLAYVFAALLLIQLDEVLDDALVEVLATQMGVTVR